MDEALSLPLPGSPLALAGPFTRAMALDLGITRPTLDRLLRAGVVRRLLRGVYAATTWPDDRSARAAAVALVAGGEDVVVDRTAAWIHGVSLCGEDDVQPLDTLRTAHRARGRGSRLLADRDVGQVEGLRLTTPLRTALDLGRLLAPDLALAAMDGLLATGAFSHSQLLAELPRLAGHRGAGQLRWLAAQVDERAAGVAESCLRLRWHLASLPTAVPGLRVSTAHGPLRLSLGVESRQFGAVLSGQVPAYALTALEAAGWRVVVLPAARVRSGDPQLWMRHLEREYHQHLLAQLD